MALLFAERPRLSERDLYPGDGVIPLKDYNPTRHFPYVTVVLIALNLVVYFFVQRPASSDTLGELRFTYRYAAIPCEVVEGRALSALEINQTLRSGDDQACILDRRSAPAPAFPDKGVYLAVLFSMFLHGSPLHIAGNMLYLWVFGNNIEDRMHTLGYLGFYLLSGLFASLAHFWAGPTSTIPVVGASGAVAGVMGAYLVLYPNVQIKTLLLVILIFLRDLPAKFLLGFWFISQFFISPSAGVAWVAHVGGFVFGAAVALLLKGFLRPHLGPARPYEPY